MRIRQVRMWSEWTAGGCRNTVKVTLFRHYEAGRLIPSFFIFDSRVVRFIPRISAAPPLPAMRQAVFTRTPRICLRSTSSRLPLVGMPPGADPVGVSAAYRRCL